MIGRLFTAASMHGVLVLGAVACITAVAAETRFVDRVDGNEPSNSGWQLTLDNDGFIDPERDRDYTGGFAFTLSGRRAGNYRFGLHSFLHFVDGALGVAKRSADGTPRHLIGFGMIALTPGDISVDRPQQNERPFASLLYLQNSRLYVSESRNHTYQTTLTVGILGSKFAAAIQEGIHKFGNGGEPRGYDYQISDGGEPTARYSLARQTRLASGFDAFGNRFDIKYALEADVGYITEGSAAVSLRWGRVASRWWEFAPSRSNYLPQAIPLSTTIWPMTFAERYVWASMTVRARAYNALLQGQFRNSAVSFSGDELNPLIGEVSAGLTTTVSRNWIVNYSVHFRTSEIRRGNADRSHTWGGLTLSRRF